MNRELILERIADLLNGYENRIAEINTANGGPVLTPEISALVTVCHDLESLLADATGKRADSVGDWLQSLKEGRG